MRKLTSAPEDRGESDKAHALKTILIFLTHLFQCLIELVGGVCFGPDIFSKDDDYCRRIKLELKILMKLLVGFICASTRAPVLCFHTWLTTG